VTREVIITPSLIASMTVGEIELVEDRTGRPISAMFDDSAPKGVALHALAHVQLRREYREAGRPEPTWEESGEVRVVMAEDEGEAHPTPLGRRQRRAG
jgi:hypothetical protein